MIARVIAINKSPLTNRGGEETQTSQEKSIYSQLNTPVCNQSGC